MKLISWTLGVTMMGAAALVGCSAEATEPTESSTSELNPSCIGSIDAPVGSKAWRAALDACIAETTAQSTNQGGSACQTSSQCNNGVCKCGSGPNANKTCDGKTTTGATSCSVMCRSCTGSSSSAGGGATPPPSPPSPPSTPTPPATPTPSGGGSQSCQTGIQCNNGACVCTDGPPAGKPCDGSTSTGTKSCAVMCRVCN